MYTEHPSVLIPCLAAKEIKFSSAWAVNRYLSGLSSRSGLSSTPIGIPLNEFRISAPKGETRTAPTFVLGSLERSSAILLAVFRWRSSHLVILVPPDGVVHAPPVDVRPLVAELSKLQRRHDRGVVSGADADRDGGCRHCVSAFQETGKCSRRIASH